MLVNGKMTIKVSFSGLEVEDDSESFVLDAVFPEGWEGELDVTDMDIEVSDDDDDEDEDEQ